MCRAMLAHLEENWGKDPAAAAHVLTSPQAVLRRSHEELQGQLAAARAAEPSAAVPQVQGQGHQLPPVTKSPSKPPAPAARVAAAAALVAAAPGASAVAAEDSKDTWSGISIDDDIPEDITPESRQISRHASGNRGLGRAVRK